MILNIDSTHSSMVLVTVNGATFPMQPLDKVQITLHAAPKPLKEVAQ